MKLSEFDYNLPQGLIAQYPNQKRDESRMMVLNRDNLAIEHKNLPVLDLSFLPPKRVRGKKLKSKQEVRYESPKAEML